MSLLSELCSICYVEKPKYRCPRCKTGTCSLPCYKRHQQRASCSGQRDPAEYLKKSQLATPQGIDRDYNYLKGVERDIDNASRETYDRGIGSKHVTKSFSRGIHPESKLQQYLNMNRITIARAPKGMSRQRTNQTRCTKRDHIMWTVEWVDSDGTSRLQDNCLETETIEDTYSTGLTEKAHLEERRLDPGESSGKRGKKRKRQEQQQERGAAKDIAKDEAQDETNDEQPSQPSDTVPTTDENLLPETTNPEETISNVESKPVPKEEDGPQKEETPKPDRFFYILKAKTSSANKVLIPLMPNCTLTESLQDQTVFEYPTYYVLPYSPGKLPPGYLTEHQYLKIRKGEEEELDEALVKAEKDGVLSGNENVKNEPGTSSGQVDANKILDMLRRDVTR